MPLLAAIELFGTNLRANCFLVVDHFFTLAGAHPGRDAAGKDRGIELCCVSALNRTLDQCAVLEEL
jgi:hypothetical protein